MSKLLQRPVIFVSACVGDEVKQAVKRAPTGAILLLENLRFHPEEEANDSGFAHDIVTATGARYFVQDGFGVVHRAHASTSAITHELPSVAGLLLEKEYVQITGAMNRPKRPLVAILGGAKVSDKIAVIERLVGVADRLLIGGAMANTFLRYKGHRLGTSKLESVDPVLATVYHAAARKVGKDNVNDFLQLPSDIVVAANPDSSGHAVPVTHVSEHEMALDIGPETAVRFAEGLKDARTILWNGTLGFAEKPAFAVGSNAVADAIAASPKASSIVGGGDTADFALKWQGDRKVFTHISTGGGASLELMAGEKLPGIEALLDA